MGDVQGLKDGSGTYTVMPNDDGGIVDDTVITKVSHENLYMVLNAACRDKDLGHLNNQLKAFNGDCKMQVHDDRSLIAVQGPKAAEAVQQLTSVDLSKLYFGMFKQGGDIAGVKDCWFMRTGYAS